MPLERYLALMRFCYQKKVAVIGPAYAVSEDDLREYDIVVRLNNHWQIGQRIDWLYHNCSGAVRIPCEFATSGLTHAFCVSTGPMWPLLVDLLGPLRAWPVQDSVDPFLSWWSRLTVELGGPFIGATAVAHLLSLPVISVFCTGMDLYVGKDDERMRAHNRNATAHWFLRQALLDRRLTFHPNFQQALLELGSRASKSL